MCECTRRNDRRPSHITALLQITKATATHTHSTRTSEQRRLRISSPAADAWTYTMLNLKFKSLNYIAKLSMRRLKNSSIGAHFQDTPPGKNTNA